jgi:hypothetical protein
MPEDRTADLAWQERFWESARQVALVPCAIRTLIPPGESNQLGIGLGGGVLKHGPDGDRRRRSYRQDPGAPVLNNLPRKQTNNATLLWRRVTLRSHRPGGIAGNRPRREVRKQEVTLRDPASALLPYNPVGRVPTLELDDGTILTESLLILSYIDTLHPGRPLLPRDGTDRWRTLAEMGIAAGMLEGIVTWSRELRRPDNARSPGVIALENHQGQPDSRCP